MMKKHLKAPPTKVKNTSQYGKLKKIKKYNKNYA